MQRQLITELIVSEALKKHEGEAKEMIRENYCSMCPFGKEDCFPCSKVDNILPQVEEVIAAKTCGGN